DIRDCGRNITGPLEAAMVGEWDSLLPCVHEQCRAAGEGHATDHARTFRGGGGADAHTSHIC
ncbi:hypothetical protein NDU88_012117, partial [Pleurodeles waltl]